MASKQWLAGFYYAMNLKKKRRKKIISDEGYYPGKPDRFGQGGWY